MAIDTAAKRRSISGIIPALSIVGVSMDATPDEAWRAAAGWGYVGIEVVAPTADDLFQRSPAAVPASFGRGPAGSGGLFQRSPPVPEVTL